MLSDAGFHVDQCAALSLDAGDQAMPFAAAFFMSHLSEFAKSLLEVALGRGVKKPR